MKMTHWQNSRKRQTRKIDLCELAVILHVSVCIEIGTFNRQPVYIHLSHSVSHSPAHYDKALEKFSLDLYVAMREPHQSYHHIVCRKSFKMYSK